MSGQQNNSSNQLSLLKPYDIPVLRQGKEGYISFNTFDPAAGKMRRKKIKINHIKKSERKFTPEYKFYSLKDNGITNMLRKCDTITVRDQARHSDILMTDIYTPHDLQEANGLIKNMMACFSVKKGVGQASRPRAEEYM